MVYERHPPRDAERRGRGFTLVELLAAIGVIAILPPVMNAARSQAKAVVCQSNLRQLGTEVARR